jgi:hypothetical protein
MSTTACRDCNRIAMHIDVVDMKWAICPNCHHTLASYSTDYDDDDDEVEIISDWAINAKYLEHGFHEANFVYYADDPLPFDETLFLLQRAEIKKGSVRIVGLDWYRPANISPVVAELLRGGFDAVVVPELDGSTSEHRKDGTIVVHREPSEQQLDMFSKEAEDAATT